MQSLSNVILSYLLTNTTKQITYIKRLKKDTDCKINFFKIINNVGYYIYHSYMYIEV